VNDRGPAGDAPASEYDAARKKLRVTFRLPDGSPLSQEITFPLADGHNLVRIGKIAYEADGLATAHSTAWMRDPAFVEAYRCGMATGHRYGEDLHIEWRVHLACWAASVAKELDGDFVECGVNTGIFSAAICSYIDFNRYPQKRFYLLDTFEGFPADQFSTVEVMAGTNDFDSEYYFDTFALVRQTFAKYPNVVLIKGTVPETLSRVPSERIAYLCLDMNAEKPERAAIEFFWDKIVPGGVVLLDDYGFTGHAFQRASLDEFAREKGVSIFTVPTGHGLLIKPPR